MRKKYIIGFLIFLVIEILIALFVQGGFVRYYLGDIIVVWVVYCFAKMIFPDLNSYLTAFAVMHFAFVVEFFQYINIVDIIGLGNIKFFRVLIGTSFSFIDLLCYAVGTIIMMILIFICKKLQVDND